MLIIYYSLIIIQEGKTFYESTSSSKGKICYYSIKKLMKNQVWKVLYEQKLLKIENLILIVGHYQSKLLKSMLKLEVVGGESSKR